MRRKYIDWLRIFGIFLLFPFHAARVFDSREFNYIHSDATSSVGEAFMDIIWPWFMPLMFLIAGVATWYALQKRDAGQYVKERILRLFIPLVLGIVLIVPIQGYMARLQQGNNKEDISPFDCSYFLFFPACFCHVYIYYRQGRRKYRFLDICLTGWFLMSFVPLTISEALPDIGKESFSMVCILP